jgi:hypothetical protein
MPLVLDPSIISKKALRELHRSLREDLEATSELVEQPAGAVRDPASIVTAKELLRSTLAVLDLPGRRSPEALAAEVNLTYSTMVSVIDLVKSHTDVPRVPRARPKG